jgi:ABC-2 type transport system permease protein
MFIVAMAISSLGVAVAARLKTMQGFQMITNFLLMPMFFLSGALFPLTNAPKWMDVIAKINPVTYGVDAMRSTIINIPALQLHPIYIDLLILTGIIVVMTFVGIILFNRPD